jgi:signal peptidase I
MKAKSWKKTFRKVWHFIWEDDSPLSWIVNIVVAFFLIKYLIYPGLGLVFATSHPVVAVVSGSMEHGAARSCDKSWVSDYGDRYCIEKGEDWEICGKIFEDKPSSSLDSFWNNCGDFYDDYGIDKENFSKFSFKNGFNTGDIIVLFGRKPEKLQIGDVIVFQASHRPDPIIHRIIKKEEVSGEYFFTTKGDHNADIHPFEQDFSSKSIIGRAVFRIPFLGYIKIWAVDMLKAVGIRNLI